MPDILKAIFAIAMVVFGLGMVIFLHEAGHFIMAKKNKVRVEIFSLGFGPAIWSFQRGETEYRLSWVPLDPGVHHRAVPGNGRGRKRRDGRSVCRRRAGHRSRRDAVQDA